MRYREGVATFFRETARPLYGSKLVERVYTGTNVRWPAMGAIVVGGLLVLVGVLALVGVMHAT